MEDNANMATRYEREIPEGYEARIEGNKVIIELKESEDERIRKEIIGFLQDLNKDVFPYVDFSLWIAYLEKQKEQKPAEWSEEDAEMLERCIESIKFYRDYFAAKVPDSRRVDDKYNPYNEEIEWIKSLRPQPHWKPSEQ